MMRTISRFWRFFSLGFIVAFVAYLFIRWDPDKVFVGVGIGVAVGLAVAVLAEYARAKLRGDQGVQPER
jgi:hypothetical protein